MQKKRDKIDIHFLFFRYGYHIHASLASIVVELWCERDNTN